MKLRKDPLKTATWQNKSNNKKVWKQKTLPKTQNNNLLHINDTTIVSNNANLPALKYQNLNKRQEQLLHCQRVISQQHFPTQTSRVPQSTTKKLGRKLH